MLQNTYYGDVNPLPLGALCVAGAASGAFTSLLLTPIELVKCRIQVSTDAITNGLRRPNVLSVIASTFKDSGLLGFWRGQFGTLIRETGGTAAWFGSYEGVGAAFRRRRERTSADRDEDDPVAPLAIWQQLLAGAIAGMSYNLSFYPADTIKARMQTEKVLGPGQPQTFWNTSKTLWRESGIKGMYRGCGITVGRAAPSSAVVFTIYESLKKHYE